MRELTKEQIEHVAGAGGYAPPPSDPYHDPHKKDPHKHEKHDPHKHKHHKHHKPHRPY